MGKSRRTAWRGRLEVIDGEDDFLLRVEGFTGMGLLSSDAKWLAKSELDGVW